MRKTPLDRVCGFAFRNRAALVGTPLVFALVSTLHEWETEMLIWPLASLLTLAGVALRARASCHCGHGWGARKTLATTGPYAYVRNPLYWGNILILAGAGVASELVWFLPVVLGWAFLVYNAAVRHEEQRLRSRYGDVFDLYCQRVPRWIPSRMGRIEATCGVSVLRPFSRALLHQSYNFAILLPFIIKEVECFGLWPHA